MKVFRLKKIITLLAALTLLQACSSGDDGPGCVGNNELFSMQKFSDINQITETPSDVDPKTMIQMRTAKKMVHKVIEHEISDNGKISEARVRLISGIDRFNSYLEDEANHPRAEDALRSKEDLDLMIAELNLKIAKDRETTGSASIARHDCNGLELRVEASTVQENGDWKPFSLSLKAQLLNAQTLEVINVTSAPGLKEGEARRILYNRMVTSEHQTEEHTKLILLPFMAEDSVVTSKSHANLALEEFKKDNPDPSKWPQEEISAIAFLEELLASQAGQQHLEFDYDRDNDDHWFLKRLLENNVRLK